ncbi:MAG: DUF433 domain-containing protein [Cyclobacteriaceae bacterium]|nr:DUF433 domain-containing protein [Cyclobacteriaceae bacterium]
MSAVEKYITVDKRIQNGQPVFNGTHVPVQTLFLHLEKGVTITEFLKDFPSVTEDQTIGVLEIANKFLASDQISKLYEAVD